MAEEGGAPPPGLRGRALLEWERNRRRAALAGQAAAAAAKAAAEPAAELAAGGSGPNGRGGVPGPGPQVDGPPGPQETCPSPASASASVQTAPFRESGRAMPFREAGPAKRQRLEGEGGAEGLSAAAAPLTAEEGVGAPPGWLECPSLGQPVGAFLPCKVPLGANILERLVQADTGGRFGVDEAVVALQELSSRVGVPPAAGGVVGMVIDLTNTSRYYDPQEFSRMGVQHVKVPCRGHGTAPDEAAVNKFCFYAHCFQRDNPGRPILVHCTHGFNRTGYMICSYLLRHSRNLPQWHRVEDVLGVFASSRPPGVYKPLYLRTLYDYNHQEIPDGWQLPELPQWKGALEAEDREAGETPMKEPWMLARVDEGEHMSHEDVVGEAIPPDQHWLIQKIVCDICQGHGLSRNGRDFRFAGSQPVSLALENIGRLKEIEYRVTWKADGTRYLMLILEDGTYLLDRTNIVRRVQMRWPSLSPPRPDGGPRVGKIHYGTILDGEMVVDENLVTGQKERRFLIFDMLCFNNHNLCGEPFVHRHKMIAEQIVAPRKEEQRLMAAGGWTARDGQKHPYPVRYHYGQEPFFVRRKEFYDLSASDKILRDLIPNQLTHESDGLILQPAQDRYVPGTYPDLLKWKYAHMNSVDFYLRAFQAPGEAEPTVELQVLDDRPESKTANLTLEGQGIIFPDNLDMMDYHQAIVECSWSPELGKWRFMRTRPDKDIPNAYRTYTKVWQSIQDNIGEEQLLEAIRSAPRREKK